MCSKTHRLKAISTEPKSSAYKTQPQETFDHNVDIF